MPFSSGQDSFSRFTMDMVRQYMKEEEVRAHHQSSLLRLRQKALKEKTKAELAWLEHQKRHWFTFIRIHVVQLIVSHSLLNVMFCFLSCPPMIHIQ